MEIVQEGRGAVSASLYGLEIRGILNSLIGAFALSCAAAVSRPMAETEVCPGVQMLQSTVALENASYGSSE